MELMALKTLTSRLRERLLSDTCDNAKELAHGSGQSCHMKANETYAARTEFTRVFAWFRSVISVDGGLCGHRLRSSSLSF